MGVEGDLGSGLVSLAEVGDCILLMLEPPARGEIIEVDVLLFLGELG